jgi:hypothetical protein
MESTETVKMDQGKEPGKEDEKDTKPPLFLTSKKGRMKRYLRSASIRTLVAVAIFTLGALFVLFAWYLPVFQKLNDVNKDRDLAEQRIQDQELAIASLQTEKSNLTKELSSERLAYTMLRLEKEILDASLAVVDENFIRASLAIDQAKNTLQSLAALLPARHAQVADDLEDKLNQAGEKVENDIKTALPELRTLSGDLIKLKENLQLAP